MKSSKPLVETVADQLIKYILKNEMQSGEKLPNEFALAEKLKVGRSTLREAVKMLAFRNIVEVRQGAGTFVSAKKLGVSEDPLGLMFVRDRKKLLYDLLEIRITIEPRLAALAAQHGSEGDIEELRELCDRVEGKIIAGENHLEEDVAFHSKIAEMGENVVAGHLMQIIQPAIHLFIDVTNRRLALETIETHRRLTEAISKNDTIGAADAMFLHLIYNRNAFEKLQF